MKRLGRTSSGERPGGSSSRSPTPKSQQRKLPKGLTTSNGNTSSAPAPPSISVSPKPYTDVKTPSTLNKSKSHPALGSTASKTTHSLFSFATQKSPTPPDVTCDVCVKKTDGSYELMDRPILRKIRESVIGKDEVLPGPYGKRRLCYCDYTASGRPLCFIEDYIRKEVMPFYANTHTEASMTGLQTNTFREDARELVLKSVNGIKEKDAVIFTGSGSTAAIAKLAQILNLCVPRDLDLKYNLADQIPAHERPVIFVGPYEHHSNELIWRESIADVITIPEMPGGTVDVDALERQLQVYMDRPLKVGSFSAASNVTGITTETHTISALLHKYGALACWDYAAAAPYVHIDMNHYDERHPDGDRMYFDAIYISPHKFVGGPGTPGILVLKRDIYNCTVPTVPGGGTVTFVSRQKQEYDPNIEHREEGGTPAIIESIRCGLVFQLKDAVSARLVETVEHLHVEYLMHRLMKNPAIIIMGNAAAERLSIVSMNITVRGRLLHYNFVVALLNDLFGIQARGGCSCAGPYGMRLFGLSEELASTVSKVVMCGLEALKPGWFRVNLNYFFDFATTEFICDAIEFIAAEGWRLLPDYELKKGTGLFTHRQKAEFSAARHLTDIFYDEQGKMRFDEVHCTSDDFCKKMTDRQIHDMYIAEAHKIVKSRVKTFVNDFPLHVPLDLRDKEFLQNVYFHLPHTALEELRAEANGLPPMEYKIPEWSHGLVRRPEVNMADALSATCGEVPSTTNIADLYTRTATAKSKVFFKIKSASWSIVSFKMFIIIAAAVCIAAEAGWLSVGQIAQICAMWKEVPSLLYGVFKGFRDQQAETARVSWYE